MVPEVSVAAVRITSSSQGELSVARSLVEPLAARFDEGAELLLQEARTRFDFEQKSAVALQSKSAFYLTLVGVFAACVATSMARLLDSPATSWLERTTLPCLLLSLGILSAVAVLLSRSTLARSVPRSSPRRASGLPISQS